MEALALLLQNPIWTFVVILTRLSLVVGIVPPFRAASVPMRIRAMLVIGMAAMITPPLLGQAAVPSSMTLMLIILANELLISLLMASTVVILIAGMSLAGQLASHLGGFEVAETIDPGSNESVPVISQWTSWLAVGLFLLMDGHRQLISTCLQSFDAIPPGDFVWRDGWVESISAQITHCLKLGLRAAAPMALALILANVITALINRTFPQFNVLAVGFNINAFILIVMLFLSVGSLAWVFQGDLTVWLENSEAMWTDR